MPTYGITYADSDHHLRVFFVFLRFFTQTATATGHWQCTALALAVVPATASGSGGGAGRDSGVEKEEKVIVAGGSSWAARASVGFKESWVVWPFDCSFIPWAGDLPTLHFPISTL
jgi:hypothetical protein